MHDYITISREYHSNISIGSLNLRVNGCEDDVRSPKLVKFQYCAERVGQVELQFQLDMLVRWPTNVTLLYANLEAPSEQ